MTDKVREAAMSDDHIFVSYSRDDRDYVQRLVAYLRRSGLNVWFDEQIDKGERWDATLRDRLDTCAAVVVVMSASAEASTWVNEELERARHRGKPLLPLLLSGVPIFGVGRIQYADVTDGRMPSEDYVALLRRYASGDAGSALPRVGGHTSAMALRRPWMVAPLPPHAVDRPDLTDEVVRVLIREPQASASVVVAGLYGAGGFGKTFLARLACHRPEVKARFPGGLLWAEMGADRHGADVTTTITDLCEQLTGQRPSLANLDQAGFRLGQLLDERPPVLLVIDDVWDVEQLAPFLLGGAQSTRLVTTRNLQVLPDDSAAIRVDQLSDQHATSLLTAGLPELGPDVVQDLLRRTSGWALLVAMVNGALRRRARQRADLTQVAADLAARLAVEGPATAALGIAARRERSIHATVESNLALLMDEERERFLELGVFPEDMEVPIDMVAMLWSGTGGGTAAESQFLVEQLAELCLVADYQPPTATSPGTLRLHDVLRTYARLSLSAAAVQAAHVAFLQAATGRLAGAAKHELPGSPWWTLAGDAEYLWRFVGYHLAAAGRADELESLVVDLRWITEKMLRLGLADVDVDLLRTSSHVAGVLRQVLAREAHLLGPVTPGHSHADILACRLASDPRLDDLVGSFERRRPPHWRGREVTRMTTHWPLPDVNTAQIRVLEGHARRVNGIAVAPDGDWLATASEDKTVRIWDMTSGACRGTLSGHTDAITAVAVAPDGTWLATSSADRTIRLWDPGTGAIQATLRGHDRPATAVAIASDGTWLASGGHDNTARLWDVATGTPRAMLRGHTDTVTGVAIAADGSWLVTSSRDGTVRMWDASTGACRATLQGHGGGVTGVAVAPDGSWLATTGIDRTVRLWDTHTQTQRSVLRGHANPVSAVAIAADGAWLATAGSDRTVRVWDAETGVNTAVFAGHVRTITGIAIAPDGRWLATASRDGSARIWDTAGATHRTRRGHTGWVTGLALSPNGSWLVTSSNDRSVRIWQADTGDSRPIRAGHADAVTAVAVAPDGTWLATASEDRTAVVWDVATEQVRVVLKGHTKAVTAVAISPAGTYVATAGNDATVRIWDPVTGAATGTFSGSARFTDVAVSPDGAWLAAAGHDLAVRVWDVATGATRAVLTGHTHPVTAVAVAPDSTWIASTSDDRTIRIWDVASSTERAVLAGHAGWLTGVHIAADGTWLATTSYDGTVRIWNVKRGATFGANLATMRVDGPLTGLVGTPDGRGLFAIGARGVYSFAIEWPA